jgi:hypothetical protein
MLRKHNKFIMLLLLVTFMFSIVGSASAATFSDVSGSSTQTAAIYRLNSLGIIDGYPDGTFGPEKTITRAEFAKIACIAAGLKTVGSGMSAAASPFSDVTTNHWANGWINVAAAQGFVKGYPNGTFQPEGNITQAEVVTVLMRLLGYNDNLAGTWPSDYIAKAANLGVLDDITFVSDKDATRGEVAILTSATLDENVVAYKASDNIFEEALKAGKTYTLLADNFESTSSDPTLVYGLDLSGGDRAIKVIDPALDPTVTADATKIAANIASGTFVSYKLTDDCVISGATSILGAAGRYAEYTLNKDGDVSYIKVRNDIDYTVVTGLDPTKIKRVDSNTIKLDSGKSYDIASNFNTYSSSFPGAIYTSTGYTAGAAVYVRAVNTGFLGTNTTAVSALTGMKQSGINAQYLDNYLESAVLAAETVDLVLDKDGNIAYVNFNVWPTAPNPTLDSLNAVGIIDTVNQKTAKVSLKNGGSYTLDPDDAGNQVVIINGVVKTYQDLAENEMVWFVNKYNTDLVVAMSMTKAGTLNSYEDTVFLGKQMVKTVTVADTTYDMIKGGGYISTDEGDTFGAITQAHTPTVAEPYTGMITSDLNDALGGDATVYLSPTGKVAAILAGVGTGTSGSIYGVVNDEVQSLVNGKITNGIEVCLPDGTYATYSPDSDSKYRQNGGVEADLLSTSIPTLAPVNTLVQLTLNSDGYIDVLKLGTSIKNYVDLTAYTGITGDKDTDTITIGNNTYDVSNAAIFNTGLSVPPDDNEVETLTKSEFMDNADSGMTGCTGIYAIVSDGVIKDLVFNDSSVVTANKDLAIVTGTGFNSDGSYVKLMTTGDPVQYTIKGSVASTVYYAKGNVVNYKLSSGDAELNSMNTGWVLHSIPTARNLTVTKVSNNIITIKDDKGTVATTDDTITSYSVDSDTLYFDFTDTDPIVAAKGDFAAGDYVLVYQKTAAAAISAIVLVD